MNDEEPTAATSATDHHGPSTLARCKRTRLSGPNYITLREARANFLKFGACDLSAR